MEKPARRKFVIIRGVHPTEYVAFHTAKEVAELLRDKGHDVQLHTVNLRKTNLYKALRLLDKPESKPRIASRPLYEKSKIEPDTIFLSFHDTSFDRKKFRKTAFLPHSPNYYDIELPVADKPSEKRVRDAFKKLAKTTKDKLQKLYQRETDLDASEGLGFFGPHVSRRLVREIHKRFVAQQ